MIDAFFLLATMQPQTVPSYQQLLYYSSMG